MRAIDDLSFPVASQSAVSTHKNNHLQPVLSYLTRVKQFMPDALLAFPRMTQSVPKTQRMRFNIAEISLVDLEKIHGATLRWRGMCREVLVWQLI